jgi:hypothetical protein
MLKKTHLYGSERIGYVDYRKMTNGFVFWRNGVIHHEGTKGTKIRRRTDGGWIRDCENTGETPAPLRIQKQARRLFNAEGREVKWLGDRRGAPR